MSTQHNVCVPMKVEAFRLNTAACNGPSRLAPISLPDYTHLRLDELLTHDVQEVVDLHNTARGPAFSDRVTDLATGETKRNRLGMYIRWLIPHFYRTGLSVTQSADQDAADLRNKRGYQSVDESQGTVDPQSPTYRALPTRWVIVRHLLTKSPSNANIPAFQAFVIESDRLRQMEDLGPDVDTQVDVSPFVYMDDDRNSLDYQAETFIGFRQPLADWTERMSDQNILRVPLSVLTSVNPLFTDYQPHNTNVFSMIDNFSYDDGTGGTAYLESATANYYVLGWHPNSNDDPFRIFDPQNPPTHTDRFDACFMKLAGSDDDTDNWMKASLSSDEPTRAVSHGVLYGVEWDIDGKPAAVPADVIAQSYNDCSPISVGVNPVDALLAVTHTRALAIDQNNKETADADSKPDPLAQDMLSLQTLVIKQQEDPDSQLQGADQLYTSYFVPAESGQRWHVSGAATSVNDKRPTVPTTQELNDLDTANDYQMALDLSAREMKWLQWEIWAEWWKWVSSHRERTDDEKEAVKNKVNGMVYQYTELDIQRQAWTEKMDDITQLYNWETVTAPRYYSSRDPTMLLCGMKSGWPTDFGDLLKVRLDSQIVKFLDIYDGDTDGWTDIQSSLSAISQKLPAALQDTAKALLTEFYALRPVPADTPHLIPTPDSKLLYPLYHDKGPDADVSPTAVWRDQWNGTQPWFPLFAEWEMEYFHIDAENWVLAPRESYGPPKLFAQIKDGVDISGVTNKQTITGRSLVLPQTMDMLKNTVEQLVKNKSTTPEDMKAIHAAINKLEFLTMSISGLSSHLTTKMRGSHLSPIVYEPGYGPQPLVEALLASQGVIDENAIRLMVDTTLTPFGDFPNFEDATYDPFKPATHGQFRFTKLNIIDMFGQAVSAIDPARGVLPNLLPYVSEFYACQVDNSTGTPTPRTVRPSGTPAGVGAQFAQMGPAINQESRLNAHYVKWVDGAWIPVTEYDNPIWGWLVVNYVDNGLQVFLPDGTFYREIRLGGPDGVSLGIRAWLPFDPPDELSDPDDTIPPQLTALIKKLKNPDYLQEFFDIMTGALDDTMYAPNQYAGYLPAITGKPFALVTTGWSLELSQPPLVNQSTSVPAGATPEPGLGSYGFQVKFGDPDRTFDGLLGYFTETTLGDFDLEHMYTYFPGSDPNESMTVLIEPDNFPSLKPFYNYAGTRDGDNYTIKKPAEVLKEYNDQLQVFGMLVDPFTVIHAYTGFQPVQVLKLPQWALEQSLKNITAFFHMGPIIMPHDVPTYDPQRKLTSGSSLDDIPDPPEGTPSFPVPSVAIADWAWLQPFVVPPATVDSITYNPFSLSSISTKPELGSTPYTAVEGYLYLKKPITSPDLSS